MLAPVSGFWSSHWGSDAPFQRYCVALLGGIALGMALAALCSPVPSAALFSSPVQGPGPVAPAFPLPRPATSVPRLRPAEEPWRHMHTPTAEAPAARRHVAADAARKWGNTAFNAERAPGQNPIPAAAAAAVGLGAVVAAIAFVLRQQCQAVSSGFKRLQATRPSQAPGALGRAWSLAALASDSSVAADRRVPKNYREVPFKGNGSRVFRSGEPDTLSAQDMAAFRTVLDLRSPSERDPAADWMGDGWEVRDFVRGRARDPPPVAEAGAGGGAPPVLWRIDVLDADRLYDWLEAEWWSPAQRARAAALGLFSGREVRRMQLRELNSRGLAGTYEAMLETSGPELLFCLQLLRDSPPPVLVHCVKGKDRTGLVSMLLLSVLGYGDDVIVADYFESDAAFQSARATSPEDAAVVAAGDRLDWAAFSGAPAQNMVSTLAYIRRRWGSVDGYLDSIGFDADSRDRLRVVMSGA